MRLAPVVISIAAACTLISEPAAAFRMHFEVTHRGVALEGAEVCFQPAAKADHTFQRWLSSNQLRCLPADSVLDFPKGEWNYFARHLDGNLISANPQILHLESAGRETGYRAVNMVVEAAGSLDFSGIKLTAGQQLFVWYPNRDSPFGTSIHPLPDGATQILVPANQELVPLVAERGRPTRLLEPVLVPAGETKVVRERVRKPGTTDLVAWIRMDVMELRKLEKPEELTPFQVQARMGRTAVPARFPIKYAAAAHLSLIVFTDLPRGTARIELSGGEWKKTQREVLIRDEPLLVVDDPLVTGPAARLTASWTLPAGATVTDLCGESPSLEKREKSGPAEAMIRLERCTDDDETDCEMVELQRVALRDREDISFENLPAGTYAVQAIVAGVRGPRRIVNCRTGLASRVDVTPEFVVVRGRVTRNDEAIAAALRFERGVAMSDAHTGQYTLLADREVQKSSVVRVTRCGDAAPPYATVLEQPLMHGSVVDIEMTATDVAVAVHDRRTGRPIAAANLTYTGLDDKDKVIYAAKAGTTGANGQKTLENLDTSRKLQVCANAAGYSRACTELRFDKETPPEHVRVELDPEHGRRGRIVSDEPLRNAVLFTATGHGDILETVAISEDGTFGCFCAGAAYVVLISDSHPLFVLLPPQETDGELQLVVRPAEVAPPVRVYLSPSARLHAGRISIAIAGRPVPLTAISNHLIKRQLPTVLSRGEQTVVRDVAAAGPIEVILMPLYEDIPPAFLGKDLAILPEWQDVLQRAPVTNRALITFH